MISIYQHDPDATRTVLRRRQSVNEKARQIAAMPTTIPPGPGKVEILARRYEFGAPLWNAADANGPASPQESRDQEIERRRIVESEDEHLEK